jgi:hypothetical protein
MPLGYVMDAKQLGKYRRRLYSRVPLIGGWLRKRAAQALARDGSPGAVRALAEAVAQIGADIRIDDEEVHRIGLAALRQITDRRAIDAACDVWAATRHADLTALLIDHQWVASTPPEVKVLAALKVGQVETVTRGQAEVVEPLVQACDDADPTIAGRARQALPNLRSKAAQEALCRLLIERDHPAAQEAALAAGYVPEDEHQRALFLFLTEQWERYDGLDFDRQLLRTSYELSDPPLRQRIREKLRAAGRPDFLTVITGGEALTRVADMVPGELDLLTQTLIANQEWATLWKLTFEVPLAWSVRIVQVMARSGWQPEIEDAQSVLDELVSLAAQDLPTSAEDVNRLFPPALLQAQARVPGRINDVAFSPLRPVIAIGTGQRKVVLWNYQRAERERVLGEFAHSIGCVTFTGDNTLLCAERTNATDVPCAIYGWYDGWSDDRPFRLGHHRGSVTAIVPVDESQVLSTGRDYEAVLWDVHTGREVSRRSLYFWARSARVSPNGQWVALLAKGLNLVTLPQLDRLTGIGTSRGVIRCAAFLPDGRTLIAGRFNGDVTVYEYKRKGWLTRKKGVLTRHEGRVAGVEILYGRSIVVTAGSEGRVRFMELKDRTTIGEVQVPLGQVTSLHISPDELFMATGNSEASLSLWDLRGLDARQLLTNPFAQAEPSAMMTNGVLVDNQNLDPRARSALKFAECALRHRFRFDIELGEAPTIMMGEFDIEIE